MSILVCYRGSIAHNLYDGDVHSIDDIDLMSFEVPGAEHYLGLTEWGQRGTREYQDNRLDVVQYELRKAVRLLVKGNPNVLSMLWCQDSEVLYQGEGGKRLRENRALFHGRHLYHPFIGYAHGQMKRMVSFDRQELELYLSLVAEMKARGIHPQGGDPDPEWQSSRYIFHTDDDLRNQLRAYHSRNSNLGYLGHKRKKLILERGYDCKNASHLIRLLWMIEHYLRSGEMNIWCSGGARDQFMAIKQGRWRLAEVQEAADHLFQTCKQAAEANSAGLPDYPDKKAIERVLVGIIEGYLFGNLASEEVPSWVTDTTRQWCISLRSALQGPKGT